MAIKSLQVLFLGSQTGMDKGFMTFGVDIGKKVESPFLSFLIRADEGNILVDTGLNPDDVQMMSKMGPINLKDEHLLTTCLQKVGLSLEDINMVVMTHLHGDHVGWLTSLGNAEVIVQKEEYKFAFDPPPYTRYIRERYNSPNVKWRYVDGDQVLIPGLTLLFTPGHSAGCQSIMVDLPKFGPILLVGDAGFLQENFQKELIPASFYDQKEALLSIKRLNVWSKVRNATIFTSHDIDYWRHKMLKSPEAYF
jgi:N-acyl homoserine lactone hydrolase